MYVSGKSIWDAVDIVYISPMCEEDPKKAKFILMAERHDDKVAHALFSRFVESTATEGSALLCENYQCGIPLLEKFRIHELTNHLPISSETASKLELMGWDSDRTSLDDITEKTSAGRALLKERAALIKVIESWLVNPEIILDIRIREQLKKLVIDGKKILAGDILWMESDLEEVLREASLDFSTLSRFSPKIAFTVLASVVQAQLSHGSTGHYSSNTLIGIQLYTALLNKEFSYRTAAMIDSLRYMESKMLIGDLAGKVFLSAGSSHLIMESTHLTAKQKEISNPSCDLSGLYETISKLPAIVIQRK